MPLLGSSNKEEVKKNIKEIYAIARTIAPLNASGTNSINKDYKDIYEMAHLANGIARDFLETCNEIQFLNLQLAELRRNTQLIVQTTKEKYTQNPGFLHTNS